MLFLSKLFRISCRNQSNNINRKDHPYISFFYSSSSSLASSNKNSVNLKNYRSLISIKGPDASSFLQGVITNDIYKFNLPNNPVIYSMILNNRGRVLFDVLIYNLNYKSLLFSKNASTNNSAVNVDKEQNYLVETDYEFKDKAIKFFNLMKIKKKIEINSVDNEFSLFALWKNHSKSDETAMDINNQIKMIKPEFKKTFYILHDDPRWNKLGQRFLIRSDVNEASKYFNLNINDLNGIQAYKKMLYKNGVPENNDDFKFESSIPLEYNLVFMNGVQFDKGCYLGQELVAKTHTTGVIRKRVMPIKFLEDFNAVTNGNEIFDEKTNKSIGKLINSVDEYGLAMIRLQSIKENNNLYLVDKNQKKIQIQLNLPEFWKDDSVINENLRQIFSKTKVDF